MTGPAAAAPRPGVPAAPGHAGGVAMVLLGGTCLSIAGVLLRNVEHADGWQILFYRGLSFFVAFGAFLLARERGRLPAAVRAMGARGILVATSLAIASVLYVFGMLVTTVANVVFIISTAPLLTALLARVVLGERVLATTWVAMICALGGVALMVADGLVAGGGAGIACALGVAACFAVMLTALRASDGVDMLPAVCGSGLLTALLVTPMVSTLAISASDLALCIVLGTVQFGAGFVLITLGAQRVPAAEVALLSLSEAVLAPIWVWLWVGEVPSGLTLAGGGVVLAAVAARALAILRRHAPAP